MKTSRFVVSESIHTSQLSITNCSIETFYDKNQQRIVRFNVNTLLQNLSWQLGFEQTPGGTPFAKHKWKSPVSLIHHHKIITRRCSAKAPSRESINTTAFICLPSKKVQRATGDGSGEKFMKLLSLSRSCESAETWDKWQPPYGSITAFKHRRCTN